MVVDNGRVIFVDRLSVTSWLGLLPHAMLLWMRRTGRRLNVYYFELSPGGRLLQTLLEDAGVVNSRRADFSYVEVQSSDGSCAGFKIEAYDSGQMCDSVWASVLESNPIIARYGKRFNLRRVKVYLEKCLVQELAPKMLLVNAVASHRFPENEGATVSRIFFIARSRWFKHLRSYADLRGIELRAYRSGLITALEGMRTLWRIGVRLVKGLVSGAMLEGASFTNSSKGKGGKKVESTGRVALAGYKGRDLTLDLSKSSDLFWIPFCSRLPRDRFLLYFAEADSPDERELEILSQATVPAVRREPASRAEDLLAVLKEGLTLTPLLLRCLLSDPARLKVHLWVALQMVDFVRKYNNWRRFFSDFNVRVNVDFQGWVKERLPMDQAIADLGGVSVSYQFTAECYPEILRARVVDVHFGSSPLSAETERQSGSQIGQLVATGYVRDYAFDRVRHKASALRKTLGEQGARFIVCFFDESFSEDARVGPSRESQVENYRYLLTRLIEDRELGLVFKPKRPATLDRFLEPCDDLLSKALATGRCYIFKEGVRATVNLPCEAALASDLTISLLYGTSPALESALAGTPTILLDREGLPFHPLHMLGTRRVIFKDWDSLWNTLWAHRTDPASVPGFGDWSPVLNRFDPFRDGRAAERIGSYISWLAEGLEDGLSREETMEMARRRYVATWGEDKICEVQGARYSSIAGVNLW